MSIIKLITTVSLAVALITMVTSNQLSIYASATTDDGYTYPDDATEEEKEDIDEQEQEAWEDAGRPGEIDDGDDDNEDENDNNNGDGLVECEDGSLVETEELCEQSEALVTCSDGSSAATQAECPPEAVSTFVTCSDGTLAETQAECPSISTAAPQEQLQTCQDGSVVSVNEACPVSETLTCPDGSTVSVDEDCPPTDKNKSPLPDCDGSFQVCKTQGMFVCPAGSAAHECECSDDMSDCPNHPSQEQKECYDGIIVVADQPCPPPKDPSPYCGTPAAEDSKSCWDVKDCSEDTGLCSCNDGTHKVDWKNCDDVSSEFKNLCKKNPLLKECYDNGPKEKGKNGGSGSSSSSSSSSSSKTTIINSNAVPNAAEVSNCRLDGNAHGVQQKFDSIKYQACGLYPNGQIAYTDGFELATHNNSVKHS